MTSRRRLTIGLPVRNGERHLDATILSILQQTFTDFQLVVYDNASTDRTAQIADFFVQQDARVRLVRHPQNIGGAANFIYAAERANTPLFCWAAHDDLREPSFLARLVSLLDAHPEIGLASCAVRNIDPDGTLGEIRPETSMLVTTTGMKPIQRSQIYLRSMAGTPFYGVFRTQALHESIAFLRELHRLAGDGPALLGIDMLFLARFVCRHGIAVCHEPLLLFRRGGVSHDLGRYGSLASYLRQIFTFRRMLRDALDRDDWTFPERARLCLARSNAVVRWLASKDMRRMTSAYLIRATPFLSKPRARMATCVDPVLRRLRKRLRDHGAKRVVLFGAGKHTRRRLEEIRLAAAPQTLIVACCDDRVDHCESVEDLPLASPGRLAELKPDVLLVSSDTYEPAMYRRALQIAPRDVAVWAMYDMALEASAPESTASMKLSISANPLLPASGTRG